MLHPKSTDLSAGYFINGGTGQRRARFTSSKVWGVTEITVVHLTAAVLPVAPGRLQPGVTALSAAKDSLSARWLGRF